MSAEQTAAARAQTTTIRLAIVHRYVAVLEGLASWLQTNAPEVEIVMLARSWEDARDQSAVKPDAYLIDGELLGLSVLAERMLDAQSDGAVVVVWGSRDADLRARLIGAGALAVLGRNDSISDARAAVLAAVGAAVAPGQGPAGGQRALSRDSGVAAAPSVPTFPRLSLADVEVIRLYANGSSPVDIALAMNVRFDWVRDHLARVRGHYEAQGRGASTRRDLVRRATEDGLLEA